MSLTQPEQHVETLKRHMPHVFEAQPIDVFDGWLVSRDVDLDDLDPVISLFGDGNRLPFEDDQLGYSRDPWFFLTRRVAGFPGAPMSNWPPSPSTHHHTSPPPLPNPDSLGFYLSFHHYPSHWGIYLRRDKVAREIENLLIKAASAGIVLTLEEASAIIIYFVHAHEAFHHAVECLATKAEVVHREPLYKAGFRRYFEEYCKNPHRSEEAVANGYGYLKVLERMKDQHKKFKWGKKQQEKIHFLDRLFRECFEQGEPGYNGGLHYMAADLLDDGKRQLAEGSWQESMKPSHKGLDPAIWSVFPHAFHGFARINSKVNYLVHASSRLIEDRQQIDVLYEPFSGRYADCTLGGEGSTETV
ncbi:MAG: hypothetical protein M9913_05010 [Bryobacteraceae bacterium]|nr:hypothetical protein [Bryobacteraceae bacterium]